MELIEWIKDGDDALALIIRNQYSPAGTEFLTPNDYKQQVGFIVYGKGEKIEPHDHKPLQRSLVGTSEALLIKKGIVETHIYSRSRELVKVVTLYQNDLILLIAGGHGFRMIEDAVMIEIKQGPYIGLEEKERFGW